MNLRLCIYASEVTGWKWSAVVMCGLPVSCVVAVYSDNGSQADTW